MTTRSALRFGISRKQGGKQLIDGAEQFAEELGTALRIPVKLSVALSYQQLFNDMVGGDLEVAWLPPLLYLQAMPWGVHLAAVAERGGSAQYRSALAVHGEGHYATVSDLKGARAAWVDRQSASGYLFPQLHLLARGLNPDQDFASVKFYGSAMLAAAAVVGGEADLCGLFVSDAAGTSAPWERAREEIRQQLGPVGEGLRVLDVTEPIPSDGMVLGAHLDPGERTRIQEVLHRAHELDFGADALATLLQADRLVPPPDAVRRMLALARGLPRSR